MPQVVKPADCLFCKIARGHVKAELIHEDEHCVAFHDINPQAPVHVLILPRRHIGTLNDLTPADAETVGHLFIVATRLAADHGIDIAGYRTVFNCNEAAGQTVWHLHLHLLGGRVMSWPPG
jgi:histidine triad (HIT) family protein